MTSERIILATEVTGDAPDFAHLETNARGNAWEDGRYALMRERLSTERGKKLYAHRRRTVEPVYGQIKSNRQIERFTRRGGAAAQSE